VKNSDLNSIPKSEQGSALLAALCLAIVFAISISSYIAMCYLSLGVSTRAMANDHCQELAEAGLEHALYSFNYLDWTGWNQTTSGVTTTYSAALTMTPGGFVATATSPTAFTFGNGAIGTVNLTMKATSGVLNSISSQGQMYLPTWSTTQDSTVPTMSRTITASGAATNGASPVFVNAVAATTGLVRFQYGGFVDSYDSGPAASPQAYSTSNAGWSAVVLSKYFPTSGGSTVRLTNANINGYAAGYDSTAPSSTNWLSYGGSATIQGKNPSNLIDSSRLLTTPVPYQPVFPEATINTNGSLPLAACNSDNVLQYAANLGSSTPTYAIYNASGINLSSGIVTITGPTIIKVSGDIKISGNAEIDILPGASLAILSETGSVSINCNGGGGIVNSNTVPLAKSFALLGPNNTNATHTVYLNQAQPFYGVIYFPYLDVTINESGPTSAIYGSIVGQSVTLNNSPYIHYDVELRKPDSTVGDFAFSTIAAPATITSLVASVP
jgi:hypothetical protein